MVCSGHFDRKDKSRDSWSVSKLETHQVVPEAWRPVYESFCGTVRRRLSPIPAYHKYRVNIPSRETRNFCSLEDWNAQNQCTIRVSLHNTHSLLHLFPLLEKESRLSEARHYSGRHRTDHSEDHLRGQWCVLRGTRLGEEREREK